MIPAPRLGRIALISDVHGNLTALEAVLADIDARGITRIFNLGDYVGKGPRGREVVDLCRERCEVNILGNWDDFLPDPDREFDNDALKWWLAPARAGAGGVAADLPFCHDFAMSGRRVRLFHASEETVHRRVRFDHDEAEFLGLFTNTPATGDGPVPDVVGYADTHDPYYETDRERRTVFNTGSVGNCMGDPTPVYVILEGVMDGADEAPFSIQFVRVPYDSEAELEVGRRRWACPSSRATPSRSATVSTAATSSRGESRLPPTPALTWPRRNTAARWIWCSTASISTTWPAESTDNRTAPPPGNPPTAGERGSGLSPFLLSTGGPRLGVRRNEDRGRGRSGWCSCRHRRVQRIVVLCARHRGAPSRPGWWSSACRWRPRRCCSGPR